MQTSPYAKATSFIDSWLARQYSDSTIPGIAVAIAHKGKLLFNNAYGYANLETGEKLRPEHLFRIASHSKMFTATLIMQYVEAGKARLDDYAVLYLPWLAEHTDKRWLKVTLRQLLSHSAGVTRDGLDADFWEMEQPFPKLEAFKKSVLEASLVVDQNTQFKYSNQGFALLGLVVEALAGKPYNEVVQEKIIAPLNLKHTGIEYDDHKKAQFVTGYTHPDLDKVRRPVGQSVTYAMSAATGAYSNAADLSAFLYALQIGSKQLLDDESKREMQRTQWRKNNTTYTDEYALGLTVEYFSNRRFIGHGGGFVGQLTGSYIDPEEELSVGVLTNCLGSSHRQLVRGIIAILSYYKEHADESTPEKFLPFLGRYRQIWETLEIVAVGNKLLTVFPGAFPFEDPEELEYVNETTLRVKRAGGYAGEGELIHFAFNESGQVKSIRYTGCTMLPEQEWLDQQRSRPIIQALN